MNIRDDVVTAVRWNALSRWMADPKASKPVALDYWPSPAILFARVKRPARGFSVKVGPLVFFVSYSPPGNIAYCFTAGGRTGVYFLTSWEPTVGTLIRKVGKMYLWRAGE